MLNYATIGTPSGFRCEMWQLSSKQSAGDPKELEKELDIKTSLILPFKNAELFVFKTRLLTNGKKLNYFILYRGADEIEGSRAGSFYGSAIVILNKDVNVNPIIDVLRILADTVKYNCIEQNRFISNLSLADEEIENKTDIIKNKFSNLTECENFALHQARIQRFVLINESQKTLNEGASLIYDKYIKKYEIADIYFSVNKECAENIQNNNQLSISHYPENVDQHRNRNPSKFEPNVKPNTSSYVNERLASRTIPPLKNTVTRPNNFAQQKPNFRFFPIRTRTLIRINLLLSSMTLAVLLINYRYYKQSLKKLDNIAVILDKKIVDNNLPCSQPKLSTEIISENSKLLIPPTTDNLLYAIQVEKDDNLKKIATRVCKKNNQDCSNQEIKKYRKMIEQMNSDTNWNNLRPGDSLQIKQHP